jgi:hypothetical protein
MIATGLFFLGPGLLSGSSAGSSGIMSDESIPPVFEPADQDSIAAFDTLNVDYKSIKVDELISVNPSTIDALRKYAIQIIFGNTSLPAQLPDTVYAITDTAYSGIPQLERIEQFRITQEHNIQSTGYIFHPKKKNRQLLIYHQGHRGDFLLGKNTIGHFINKGFTVYAFCMPLLGKNNQPHIDLEKLGRIHMNGNHDYFKFLENPIGYFINPVVVMLNYAESLGFKRIHMCGISGGGWTTTLVAGIDTRIDSSFPVAGTYPLYIRFISSPEKNYGDFEQTWPELYREVNYLDFYLLGSVGKGRKQVQILNQFDPCCFDGLLYSHYEPAIQKVIREFDHGSFKVIIDSTHREHKISGYALEKIMEELNPTTE